MKSHRRCEWFGSSHEKKINGQVKYDEAAIAKKATERFSYEVVGRELREVYEKVGKIR